MSLCEIEMTLKFLLILVWCFSLYQPFHLPFFPLLFPSLSLSLSLQTPSNSSCVLCNSWRCQWRIRAPTRFSPWFSTLSSDADDLHDYRAVLYRLRLEYVLLRRRFKVLFSAFQIFPSRLVFRCLNSEFGQ